MAQTIRLLATYPNPAGGYYAPGAIITVDDAIAAQLLAGGVNATTDLAGGTVRYQQVAAGPASTNLQGGQEIYLALPAGSGLAFTAAAAVAGVVEELDGAGNATRTVVLTSGSTIPLPAGTADRQIRIRLTTGAGTVRVMAAAQVPRTYNRRPTSADNASRGYTSASAWQHAGKVYTPTVAPDSTSAVWGEASNIGGTFTEIMTPANTLSAWGTVAMKTGYTGPAVDISVTIGGVATAFTLNILPSGELDNVAAAAAVSQADANTFATCTKVYDQSGKGNDWAKDAAYLAPFFVYDEGEKRFGLTTNGPYAGTIRTLKAPAAVFSGTTLTSGFGVVGGAFTVMAYVRGNSPTKGLSAMFALGDKSGTENRMWSVMTDPDNRLYVNRNFGKYRAGNPVGVDSQAHVVTLVCAPTSVSLSVNETTDTNAHTDAQVYSSGWLFCYTPNAPDYYGSHTIFGFGVAKVTATAAQARALRYSAYARFDIRPQVQDQIMMLGDSRTAAAHPVNRPHDALSMMLAKMVGKDYRVYGLGSYGSKTADLMAGGSIQTIPFAQALYNPLGRNIVTYLCGVNDSSAGATAGAITDNIRASLAALKNTGFKTVLINELTANGANAVVTLPLVRQIIANAGAQMNADAIIDAFTVNALKSTSNTAIYADGLHPTAAADGSIVGLIAAQVVA